MSKYFEGHNRAFPPPTTAPGAGGAPAGYLAADIANFDKPAQADSTQGWTLQNGWMISSGLATAGGNNGVGYAYHDYVPPAGPAVIRIKIDQVDDVTKPLRFVSDAGFDQAINAAGTYEFPWTFSGGGERIYCGGNYGFTGAIDWVQISAT